MLETALRKDSAFLDFTRPAEALLGDSIATNMMMMGYAYQKGLLPLTAAAIEQAIGINGVAIKMNTEAFRLGRLAVADPGTAGDHDEGPGRDGRAEDAGGDVARRDHRPPQRASEGLPERAARRRYRKLVDQVREAAVNGGYGEELPRAVAINYAKLLAYKDEYEVARLFTDGRFEQQLREQFEGDYKISFNLAPPIWPAASMRWGGRASARSARG